MNHKRKKAFTLIELLVVIAIIAILAAILFPVFAQAKLAAKKAVSTSNLKQLGTALYIYTNDYDDMFPDAIHGSGGSNATPQTMWGATIYPYTKGGGSYVGTDGTTQVTGCQGIYLDAAAPNGCVSSVNPDYNPSAPGDNPEYQQSYSYGANLQIMPVNQYSGDPGFIGGNMTSVPMTTTQIPTVADSIIILTKGGEMFNVNYQTYGWFSPREYEWLGAGVARVSPAGT